jgi:hypothetical protein
MQRTKAIPSRPCFRPSPPLLLVSLIRKSPALLGTKLAPPPFPFSGNGVLRPSLLSVVIRRLRPFSVRAGPTAGVAEQLVAVAL